eukprot:scaffold14511_cov93-Cylindrotheca_fusiformis.AAC.2
MRPPQDNEADGTVATMDSTIQTRRQQQSHDDERDMEQVSLRQDSSGRVQGRSTIRPSTTKGEKSQFILMRKSTLMFLGILFLLFVIAFGYFFYEWMYGRGLDSPGTNGNKNKCIQDEVDCPFTEEDMESLTSEIDRLEALNQQLSNRLDDYEDLTTRLNASVEVVFIHSLFSHRTIELKRQNDILSESNDRYEDLNDQLSDSIAELKEQNTFLQGQVDEFANLNQDLNGTVIDLTEQVDRLEDEVTDFTAENDRLENLVQSLSNETETLTKLSNALQANVDRLEGNIGNLEQENDRLETSIDDLKTVISFWGDVSENYDETYEQMTAFLAQQIEINRVLALESLENNYHQRVAGWDCGLRARFAMEPFASDDNVSIPTDRINDVMMYVDERVLSELCLDKGDFEKYLQDRYTMSDVSVKHLETSVERYTWEAIDYYFPEEAEVGLNAEDWSKAEYNCEKLTSAQKYIA